MLPLVWMQTHLQRQCLTSVTYTHTHTPTPPLANTLFFQTSLKIDTSKTSIGKNDLVWPLWLEPSFFKQAVLWAMILQVTCLTIAWGKRGSDEIRKGAVGLFLHHLFTPAMMKFPLQCSCSCSLVFFYTLFSLFPPPLPLLLHSLLSLPHLGSISVAADTHNSDRQSAAWRRAKCANGKFSSQL